MSRFHSYLQIGPLLGAGYFGEVYRGIDEVHGEVAVKVIKQNVGELPLLWQVRKAALLKEGKTLKAASHPNVVQVFHVVESELSDAVHLIMEFCDGGSLQATYDAGPMRLCDVRKIATDITLGLSVLHAREMIHRDIKPGNLLVHKGTTKLGDFGLVTDSLILGYGSQAGYSDHIAPEVWSGKGTSIKSDIWALGMTIFRLLHGSQWYERSPSPRDIVKDGGFADTLAWLPHIPAAWRRFVRKMLDDDPSRRFQTAGEVRRGLANLAIDPRWNCTVCASSVTWEMKTKARLTTVAWNQHSTRTHTWEANSKPIGKGNRRSLGGSSKKIGGGEIDQQLKQFFANQS